MMKTVMVEIGGKTYMVDMDSDRVYVETRRFPSERWTLREIPKNGPRAIEARRLVTRSRMLRAAGF